MKLQVLVFILIVKNKVGKEIFCVETFDYKNNIIWPQTYFRTLSRPICLDNNREFLYRYCWNGKWGKAPDCIYKQLEVLPQCPPGFKETDNLCYKFTPKEKFFPKCPFKNIVPFSEYKYLSSQYSRTIWAPAKRNGLSFMHWIEPGDSYGEEVVDYNFSTPIKDKECLIFDGSKYVLVGCGEKYSRLCAYRKLNQLQGTFCSTMGHCVQSDYDLLSKCFCEGSSLDRQYKKAEFLKPYQYNIYKNITNETCSIALRKSDHGQYKWKYTNKEIGYSYWSPKAEFHDGFLYGAATSNGWILTRNPCRCIIFEMAVPTVKPTLSFVYNQTCRRFILGISDHRSTNVSVFCFTNSVNSTLPFRITNILLSRQDINFWEYEIKPVSNFSGFYWCQVLKHIDLETVTSPTIFYRAEQYLEYVGFFELDYGTINPLSYQIVSLLENSLYPLLNASDSYTLRLMEIVDLQEEQQKVTVNVHFSGTLDEMDEDREYYQLKEKITSVSTDIKLVDFLSPYSCFSENDTLTWPKSLLDSIVSPLEFCFTSEGNPVTRVCAGDFIRGAKWLDYADCKIFDKSAVTPCLLDVFNDTNKELETRLFNSSLKFRDFSSLDVYLVCKIFSELLHISSMETFGNIVSNLLRINRTVLMQAQLNMNATDKLLSFMERIDFAYNDSFEVKFDNFVFVSASSEELSGLAVDNDFLSMKLAEVSFEDVISMENIESAIWVNSDLRKSIENVTVSVYKNNHLFLQSEPVETGHIFGLMSTFRLREFKGEVKVVRKIKSNKNSFCAFWDYSSSLQGSWTIVKAAKLFNNFSVCTFRHLANFAIITKDANETSEVTSDLDKLLNSNCSAPKTIIKLSNISEQYMKFVSVDVSFVGKILEKISPSKNIEFSYLANTVNNLQQVDTEILHKSQARERSTDTILRHVDTIIRNNNFTSSTQIVSDNFVIIVGDMKDNISGIVLLEHENETRIEFLPENVSIDTIIHTEHFDSAVILSPDLKQQINQDSQILITIFSKDALFNEDGTKPKSVSKIFGVILPDIGNFTGPLSILYKTSNFSANSSHQCAFWYFVQDLSSWKLDHTPKNLSNVVQCDFWHTTHFAYLILDKWDDNNMNSVITLITNVNCVISLISLYIIILTAILFKQWRENTGNKILLNFTFVLILQIVVFYISVIVKHRVKDYVLCTIIGILLHYSIISQFHWMLVVAILQFRRFVIVLDTPMNFVLVKACVCGWALPLLPVACVFGLDVNNYVNSPSGLCYPSHLGLYLGVWLPVCIIICINIIIFSITLYNVVCKKATCVNAGHEFLYQWRLAILLFFTLGFTWGFGFLAELDFNEALEYLFCITASLQGFILFLFFIALNPNTRNLYANLLEKSCNIKCK